MQSIVVSVFYSNPQRLDVYVNNQLIAPTNAEWNADNTNYILKKPILAGTNCLHKDIMCRLASRLIKRTHWTHKATFTKQKVKVQQIPKHKLTVESKGINKGKHKIQDTEEK